MLKMPLKKTMTTRSPKGSLPHGWIVEASKQYPDRVYYFNVFTGTSTWDCPVLDPPRIMEEKVTPSKETLNKNLGHDVRSPTEPVAKHIVEDPPPVEKCSSASSVLKNSSTQVNKKSPVRQSKRSRKKKRKSNSLSSSPCSSKESITPPTAVVAPFVLDKKSPTTPSPNNQCMRTDYKNKKKQVVNVSPQPSILKGIKNNASPTKSNKKPRLMVSVSKEGTNMSNKKVTVSPPTVFPGEKFQNDLDMENFSSDTSQVNESNSSGDDIKMLDVSSDLTKIDDIAVPIQAPNDLCSYYIVIDTNVLIDDLKEIVEIKDTPLGNCGPPHIFIPWIVIQELYSLKKSTKACGTGRAAQQAVRYLNRVLKSKHPRFHGQSLQEAEDCAQEFSKCNDDKILECCMSLAQKIPAEKVVLITYDKNLINKALICGINTHNWKSLLKTVSPKKSSPKSKRSPKSKKKKKNAKKLCAVSEVPVPENNADTSVNILDTTIPPICPEGYETEVYAIMCDARQLLKGVLEPFLVLEMEEAYGDVWNTFKIDKHLLNGILDAISRYWRTVFVLHFAEKYRRNFELLKEKSHRPEGFFGDREDCLNTITAIEDVICRIKRRWSQLEAPIDKVEDLRAKCNTIFSKLNEIEVPAIAQGTYQPTEESALSVIESIPYPESSLLAFENAWTVINHLCGMIMDFYRVPHNFVYEKPDFIPPDTEFRTLMVNLYPSVLNIKKLMLGVVAAVKNHNPRKGIFIELYTALLDLVPTLQIQAMNPSVPNFTPEGLEKYCRDPANRDRIQLGCKQIEHFFAKLDEAKNVMSSCSRVEKVTDQMALD